MTAVQKNSPTALLPVRAKVRKHLGVSNELLDDVPVVSARFEPWRVISVQASLEALAERAAAITHGVAVPGIVFPDFAELLITQGVALGPIDYVSKNTGPDRTLACLRVGLMLGTWADAPIAVWIRPLIESHTVTADISIAVKSPSIAVAQEFLAELRAGLITHDPYRGKSLKLHLDNAGDITDITFEPRPVIGRDELILRPDVLDAIDLHAVGVGENADRLRAAGQHLKRGLLLYGPPGTGKTHTVRYLANRLPLATLFILTGNELAQIKVVADLLEQLAPVIVVLDDIDLIAEDRDAAGNAGSTLFNLLDAMDGMHEDVDVLFIATTNRAEGLEKAFTARPGRIDQAVEVPVPDRECRRRLISLYSQGLELRLDDVDTVLDRTAGVTASFVKELLRQATLLAIEDTEPTSAAPVAVTDAHLARALDILLDPSRPLTSALLGVHQPAEGASLQHSAQRGAGTAWCGI